MRVIVCKAEIFFVQGIRIIPFIRPWSTKTKIESDPSSAGGRSVRKSIEVWEKGHREIAVGIGTREGFVGWQLILNC